MPECYIRGTTIKYLRIPDEVIDMVKEEAVLKSRGRGEMKGRGTTTQRGGRGTGGRGKLMVFKHVSYNVKTIAFIKFCYFFVVCRSIWSWKTKYEQK